MTAIIVGSIILSILHVAIPNHWLPVVAVGRKENWSIGEVRTVAFVSALAHGVSTVIIGVIISLLGNAIASRVNSFTHWIAPGILILLGLFFIYRHYNRNHVHIEKDVTRKITKREIIIALTAAMFFSPCMEIEGYFLLAGSYHFWLVAAIALIYLMITLVGMVLMVQVTYKGLLKANWKQIEHNAGIITGIVLLLTGILAFFIS